MRFLVINGPNLNMLGAREPEVYGPETLADLEAKVDRWGQSMGVETVCEQNNSESRIIESIQTFEGDGIVINPGAFTHTSRAIADAIGAVPTPVVEVHISNMREREPWRAVSVIAPACVRTIYGRGTLGYRNAMRHLVNRAAMPFETILYGPHADNVGDLRHDGGDLVVLVHGGLWRHQYERDTVESLAVDLTGRGLRTWNIEYRRLGTGGGWPGSGQDVLTALDFIPQLGLKPGRIIVVSHSAGSQLATWAADRSITNVDLHVALSPLLDLETAVDNNDVGAAQCRLMLEGGAPSRVLPTRVRTVIVHATFDQIVPVKRSISIARDTGIELDQPDSDHFALLDPSKKHWESVLARIEG